MNNMKTEGRVLPSIAAVIHELSVQGLAKARKNDAQGFWFRGIDDVLNVLSPLFAKYHLMVIPTYGNRVDIERKTAKGNPIYYVTIEGTYQVLSTEDGSSIVAGPFPGEAMDSADKATNKAMSAAFKYFAIQTFSIPVEGLEDADDDAPEGSAPQPQIDVQQWVADINAAATREQVLELAEGAKKLCGELNDGDAWGQIKAARDARGKALAAKPKKAETAEALG